MTMLSVDEQTFTGLQVGCDHFKKCHYKSMEGIGGTFSQSVCVRVEMTKDTSSSTSTVISHRLNSKLSAGNIRIPLQQPSQRRLLELTSFRI